MPNNFAKGSEWRKWDLHVHTPSSYDYKYNGREGEDLNETLINVLKNNQISVVAITDHFIIDKKRIEDLRSLATDIVFFPGVELRTDKGDTNIHVILIFDDSSNLDNLVEDFNVFKRSKGNAIEDNEKIYWEYKDIVNFAHEHQAIISIHAGNKTNGIDKQISNLLPHNIAVKTDYASTIDIFEGGKVADIEEYKTYKFPKYGVKPLIFCSDNHNPMKYEPAAPCWIKADANFNGLKQIINEPDRVFIGDKPDLLKKIEEAPQKFIKSLSINKTSDSTINEIWYRDFLLELNPGLVSIIGNKGSGKSAIADIISFCSNSNTEQWSFLTKEKFKNPKPYDRSKNFEAFITWADNSKSAVRNLSETVSKEDIELVRYIPQNYLEKLCTTEDEITFENEIKSIIFQYLPQKQKEEKSNLDEIIDSLTSEINKSEKVIFSQIQEINKQIFNLEIQKRPETRKKIENSLLSKNTELENLIKAKPVEVLKPNYDSENSEALKTTIELLSQKKEDLEKEIVQKQLSLDDYGNKILNLNNVKETISRVKDQVKKAKEDIENLLIANELNVDDVIQFSVNDSVIDEKIRNLQDLISSTKKVLDQENAEGLLVQKNNIIKQLNEKQNLLSGPEKLYNKYLSDVKEWNEKCCQIKGDSKTPETIEFYKKQIEYIEKTLPSDLENATAKRNELTKSLISKKNDILVSYSYLYEPIEEFINENKNILKEFPIKINSSFVFDNISEKFFNFINLGSVGSFNGKENGSAKLKEICEKVELGDYDSVVNFSNDLVNLLKMDCRDGRNNPRNIEDQLKKGRTVLELYDFIYGLSYIKPQFQLKMGEKDLSSLSPGERGAILLLFYLFIDKDDKPLIIDQPEENLDNESVYKYLVSFIKAAKKKRQIIMVTHNPNLAVVCDSDQIVKMDIDKVNRNVVSFQSGSIENPKINKCIIDVLEGTYPAFDNRNRKYMV